MKNILLTILFAFTLISCEKSNEDKAKEAIRIYLNENLDDMSSYEPVKFGSLEMLVNIGNFQFYSIEKDTKYQMFHSYRIKLNSGDKILVKKYFLINENFEIKREPFDENMNEDLLPAR